MMLTRSMRTMLSSRMLLTLTFALLTVRPGLTLETRLTFRDPGGHPFQQLVVDRKSRTVFVAGTNRLHRLTADLILTQSAATGPREDNPDCPPPPRPCLGHKTLRDAVTKGLAVDSGDDTLLLCTTLYHGSCQKLSLGNITRITQLVHQPLVPNMADKSSVLFIGPGPEQGRSVVYIGAEYSEQGNKIYRNMVPTLCSRELKDLNLTFEDQSGSTAKTIMDPYRETFLVHYVQGFVRGQFAYFFTVQNENTSSAHFVSKIARVCTQDKYFSSYVEVPFLCQEGDMRYQILQDVWLENEAGSPDRLVAVFTDDQASSWMRDKSSSALCSVNMEEVDQAANDVMKKCFAGQDLLGPPHFLKMANKTCPKIPMVKDVCATVEIVKDILSMEGKQPIVARGLWKLPGQRATAVVTLKSDQHMLAYVGTADGELVKVLQGEKRGQEVARLLVDSSGMVVQIAPSGDKDHLYVLTEAKVSLIWTRHCEQKVTCEECVTNKDPMCGWCIMENRCTAETDCKFSAVTPSWQPATSSACARMSNVQPEVISYESQRSALASRQISFELEQVTVPASNDMDLGCFFILGKEEYHTKATLTNKVISCPLPNGGNFPKIPDGKDHEGMVLHFHVQGKSIVARSVLVYDCSMNTNCHSCTNSSYGCHWCPTSSLCSQKIMPCPSSTLAINASGSCPLIWTSSPDKVLVHAGEEKHIAVQVRNLQPGQKTWIKCQFAYLGTKTTVNGSISSNSLTCDSVKFDYTEKEQLPYVMADFQVLWGPQSLPLDNPLKIKVRIYKCSLLVTNCGKCLSMDAGYECGWCSDRCTLAKHCTAGWLDRTATCPGPQILRFNPTLGPINGKTHLSVSGLNLGKSYSDIKVTVAGMNCDVKPEHYEPSSGFMCETEVTSTPKQGIIEVKVDNKYTAASDSSSPFSFVDPVVVSLNPLFGPRSGGTVLAIKGENMDSGNDATVTIDGQECTIIKRNHTVLECRVPKKQGSSNQSVKVNFGGHVKTSPDPFTYKEDPIITRVEPKRSIISGGTTITVVGKQLEIIQKPEFFVTYGGQFLTATCMISSSYSMECPVPSLRPQLDSSGVNITDHSPLEVHYGFTLDGVMSLKNVSHKSDFGPLLVYPDPLISVFPGPEMTKQFLDIDNLVIGGRFSIVNNLMASVSVSVGSEPCLEVTSTESAITCKPPSSAPKGTDRSSGKAPVLVRIGNMSRQVGYLRYYEMSNTSKPMALGVILGVVIPIVAIIILLTVCVLRRHRKHKPATDYIPDVLQDYQGKKEDEEIGLNHVAVADVNGYIVDEKDCSPYVLELVSHIEDTILRQNVAAMMIPQNKLSIGEMIGKGHFGAVYKALLHRGEDKTAQVAAKTLQAKSNDADTLQQFLLEVVYLKNLHHPNLLPVLGVCLTASDDPVIITPFMATEDLKSFIAEPSKTLTVVALLSFGQQVADAMTYLQEVKVIHRNLAACNCIILEDGRVQLTDYGMTASLFPQTYYTAEENPAKNLVKWMAVEVIESFSFSHKSDVWAFGIVLWELMTRGLTPYPDVQNSSLLSYLKGGQRMRKPKQCPEPVYKIMMQCWLESVQERPDFSIIGKQLRSLLASENGAAEETSLLLNQSIDVSNSTEYLNVIV